MNLDNVKREYFKYKVCSMILLIFLGIMFASNASMHSTNHYSNNFVEQLNPEDINTFEVLYTAEVLFVDYNLSNVQCISHVDNNKHAYIISVYKNTNGKKITFIQSKDPSFNESILQQTNLSNTNYIENTYYFTQTNQDNLLFWYNNDIAYFLFTDFNYEVSKKISQEILANRFN